MNMDANMAKLSELAQQEYAAASATITAGDEDVDRRVRAVKQALDQVDQLARSTLAKVAQLHADDVMNPEGRSRLLAALPGELKAGTDPKLDQVEVALDLIEGTHYAGILHHNPGQDHNLIAELNNYSASLTPKDAAAILVDLAADPRYSTFMAGPMGRSLAARFGIRNDSLFKNAALHSLAVNGTVDQQRRSKALEGVKQMRRILELVRGFRDEAIQEAQRPPARKPTTALM